MFKPNTCPMLEGYKGMIHPSSTGLNFLRGLFSSERIMFFPAALPEDAEKGAAFLRYPSPLFMAAESPAAKIFLYPGTCKYSVTFILPSGKVVNVPDISSIALFDPLVGDVAVGYLVQCQRQRLAARDLDLPTVARVGLWERLVRGYGYERQPDSADGVVRFGWQEEGG